MPAFHSRDTRQAPDLCVTLPGNKAPVAVTGNVARHLFDRISTGQLISLHFFTKQEPVQLKV